MLVRLGAPARWRHNRATKRGKREVAKLKRRRERERGRERERESEIKRERERERDKERAREGGRVGG